MKTIDYLSLTPVQKSAGVFIEGDIHNGIYKEWWLGGGLAYYFVIKDTKIVKNHSKAFYSDGKEVEDESDINFYFNLRRYIK